MGIHDITEITGKINKVNILGVGINTVTMQDTLQKIEYWIENQEHQYVCVCANHVIMESRKDDNLRRIVNFAGLATPDGMSVVYACKFLGHEKIQRVCGTDLMLSFCNLAAKKGYTNFFYGGIEGQPEQLAINLSKMFPGLKVAGTRATPFGLINPMNDQEGIDMINRISPDVVWVGLGSPKQELWMGNHWNNLNTRVMIGVGAVFDFLTGRQSRGPSWMYQNGLEWLYRLIHNPRRLWRRNLYHFPFAYYVLLQRLGVKIIKEEKQ
jgi:N-acetylglucosaminyldiphosphoundecaprenol N-acetyl-beta-D-mannosaminyltransferase